MILDVENWLWKPNSQSSIISFDYSWFLGKTLSNFVSADLKIHNPYCHNLHLISSRIIDFNKQFVEKQIEFRAT